MIVKENLYTKEAVPEEFNKERQAVNESANNAMKPEAAYLMQIGATTDFITEEDRHAKALPADLQALLNELKEYNPELLVKDRVLAITKADMLDDQLKAEIEATLPEDIPHVFISSFTQEGIKRLKDMLWEALQKEMEWKNL